MKQCKAIIVACSVIFANSIPDLFAPTYSADAPAYQFAQSWAVSGSRKLRVRISQKSSKNLVGVLQISESSRSIFKFDTGYLFPNAVMVLEDGNLATLWTTACGGDEYYHLIVFGYANNSVKTLLHTKSAILPEFAYTNSNSKSDQFTQRKIIVGKSNWSDVLKGKFPTSANIYAWNSQRHCYDIQADVAWNQRFK